MNARMLMESWGLFCPRFLASSPGCFAAQLSAMVAHAVSHRTVGTFPSSQQTSGRHGCNISSQNYRQSYSTGVGVGSSAALIAKWQSLLEPRQPGSDPRAGPPPMPIEQMRQLMQDAIHVFQTEGAAAVVPDRVCEIFMSAYSQLQQPQHKLDFFKLLTEFGVQRQSVDAAVQLWLNKAPPAATATAPADHASLAASAAAVTAGGGADAGNSGMAAASSAALLYRLADKLRGAAEPLYMQLLLSVSQHRSGIAFLVGMRADLLVLLRAPAAELQQQGPALRALDQDIRAALAHWFSLGLLQLTRITWEDSPGLLLQRVMTTEAVHKMQHLEELRRRLQQSDRRVFAFMHPSLPGEPLVVLHTAIMDHIPSTMAAVLTQEGSRSTNSSTNGSTGSSTASTSSSNASEPPPLPAPLAQQQQQQQQIEDEEHSKAPSSNSGTNSSSSSSSSRVDQGTVACFYSVSSSQPGLAGIDLGNFLIKKAARLLLSEMPQLQTLVTLSPIPGFRTWLITKLQQQVEPQVSSRAAPSPPKVTAAAAAPDSVPMLQQHEVVAVMSAHAWLAAHAGGSSSHDGDLASFSSTGGTATPMAASAAPGAGAGAAVTTVDAAEAAAALLDMVQSNSWLQLPVQQQDVLLRPVLMRLCAWYLLVERRRNLALDPVAHFHLRNGAQLWRINWRADTSTQGLTNSCGLMVNYQYDLAQVAANNQAYLMEHTIAASEAVQQLLHTS